jgi:hypothetical protein
MMQPLRKFNGAAWTAPFLLLFFRPGTLSLQKAQIGTEHPFLCGKPFLKPHFYPPEMWTSAGLGGPMLIIAIFAPVQSPEGRFPLPAGALHKAFRRGEF